MPADDHRRALRLEARDLAALCERHAAEALLQLAHLRARDARAVHGVGVVAAVRDRCQRRGGARHRDGALRGVDDLVRHDLQQLADRRAQAATASGATTSSPRNRSVMRTHPACSERDQATPSAAPSTSSVEPPPTSMMSVPSAETAASPGAREQTPANVVAASSLAATAGARRSRSP